MNSKATKKVNWVSIIKKELKNLNNYVKIDSDQDWQQFAKKLDLS